MSKREAKQRKTFAKQQMQHMTPQVEDDLIATLRELITLEKDLEATKIQMTLKFDFNLHDAFAIFDTDRDGSITPIEFTEGLAAIGVYPTNEEVELYFKRYDSSKTNTLGFKEFSKSLQASDPYYTNML